MLFCAIDFFCWAGGKKSSNSFDGEYSAKAADTTNCGLHLLHDDNSTFRLIRPRKKLPKLARLHHGVPLPKNKTHLQQKQKKIEYAKRPLHRKCGPHTPKDVHFFKKNNKINETEKKKKTAKKKTGKGGWLAGNHGNHPATLPDGPPKGGHLGVSHRLKKPWPWLSRISPSGGVAQSVPIRTSCLLLFAGFPLQIDWFFLFFLLDNKDLSVCFTCPV